MLDFESLTLGETAFIESYSGVPLAKFDEDETPMGRMMIAMVTVMQRRNGQPNYHVAQAEALTIAQAQQVLAPDDDEPAPEPAPAVSSPPAPEPAPAPAPAVSSQPLHTAQHVAAPAASPTPAPPAPAAALGE